MLKLHSELAEEKKKLKTLTEIQQFKKETADVDNHIKEDERENYLRRQAQVPHLYDRRLVLENCSIFLALDFNRNLGKQDDLNVVIACRLVEQHLPGLYETRSEVDAAIRSRFAKIKQKVGWHWDREAGKVKDKSKLVLADLDSEIVKGIDIKVRNKLVKNCSVVGALWGSVFSQSSSIPKGVRTQLASWQIKNGRTFEKKKVK
jgi:hypothetical protein